MHWQAVDYWPYICTRYTARKILRFIPVVTTVSAPFIVTYVDRSGGASYLGIFALKPVEFFIGTLMLSVIVTNFSCEFLIIILGISGKDKWDANPNRVLMALAYICIHGVVKKYVYISAIIPFLAFAWFMSGYTFPTLENIATAAIAMVFGFPAWCALWMAWLEFDEHVKITHI